MTDEPAMDMSVRASSPLKDLLSHQYGQRWFNEQLSRSQTVDQSQLHRVRHSCLLVT